MTATELDVGQGRDASVGGLAGEQIVISVKSLGSAGRLWRLESSDGSCDVSRSVRPGTSIGQSGREIFTVRINRVPGELWLILQAPWSESPEKQYRITIEAPTDEAAHA